MFHRADLSRHQNGFYRSTTRIKTNTRGGGDSSYIQLTLFALFGNLGNGHQFVYEPQGLPKPAIYTFLGLATLPRFRIAPPRWASYQRDATNPLRLLPREIVLHIARFAYRAGYRAHWVRVRH